MTWATGLSCVTDDDGDDTATVDALDWSHASSVTTFLSTNLNESPDLYVVSLRNINTVLALRRDGSGLEWTFSSNNNTIGTNFTIASEADKFYDVHDAQMLAADTVLLMDGGNNRPGCKFPTGQNCFSRATKYRLDAATGAATLEWQFAYSFANNSLGDTTAAVVAAEPDVKDVFVADGGSVAYLVDADAYLVGFTMTPSDGRYSKFAYFFQVDSSGNATSEMLLPRHLWSGATLGAYRAVPYDSIYGESSVSPFLSTAGDVGDDDGRERAGEGDDSKRSVQATTTDDDGAASTTTTSATEKHHHRAGQR